MTDQQILNLQTNPSLPTLPGLVSATDLLLPPTRTADRLAHFPEDVYRLDPESVLARLLKVLIGDAGLGQLRKRFLLRRLQATLQGTHFFDLDRFYGALFGVQRRTNEILALDPYTGTATSDEWEEAHTQDASYRSRITQFARALSYGPTPIGIELMAEALLSVDCDVYESYRDVDLAVPGVTNRRIITVVPKRTITLEEQYDVVRVLSRIKPVDALVEVSTDGVAAHLPVELRGVHADSEYWEVISKVQPRSVTTELPYPVIDLAGAEQPRVPFGAYQGEAWTYNGDIAGVVATYRYGTSEAILPTEIKVLANGIVASYPPQAAIRSPRSLLAGRYISDAVYQAHPYGDHRLGRTDVYVDDEGQVFALLDTGETVRLSANYIDRIPVPGLTEALRLSSDPGLDPVAPSAQRFWATPERPIESSFEEVLEVRLSAPRIVNYVSFKVSHYPNIAEVRAYDDANGQWVSVYSSEVTDSIPRTPPDPAPGSDEHPLHPESEAHWVKKSGKFDRIKSSRIQLILTRLASGSPPQRTYSGMGYSGGGYTTLPTTTVTFSTSAEMQAFRDGPGIVATGATGVTSQDGVDGIWVRYNIPSVVENPGFSFSYNYEKPIEFSLAVRDLEIGYRVEDFYDVPTEPATATDLLGSTVQFELRTNAAERSLEEGGSWRSDPQPFTDAVVSFYVDTRDETGLGQIIDRFFLDPTTPGPRMNIYWSNGDVPDRDARADDDDLNYPVLVPTGTITELSDSLSLPSSGNPHLDLDNRLVQFDPRSDFTLLLGVRPRFAYNVGTHVLLDFGGYKLIQQTSLLKFIHPDGTVASVSIEYPSDVALRVVLRGGASTVSITVRYAGVDFTATATAGTPTTTQPPTLRIGAPLTGSVDSATFDLLALMLKRGSSDADDDFLATPSMTTYVIRSQRPTADDRTLNSILRFSSAFFSDDSDYGFKGGPGDYYGFLSWSPIARDYTVQAGFFHIPPTRARYWKLEFTKLVAEPYESFIPINRIVTLVPAGVSRETMWQEVNSDPSAGPPGIRAALDLGDRLFVDNYVDEASLPNEPSPSDAQYADDPSARQRLRDQSWTFGFQPWHLGVNAPSFSLVGEHIYEQVEVRHTTKVAYFVGLRAISAHRVDYTVDEDAVRYVERFSDDSNVEPGYTWSLEDGYLNSDTTANCAARGVVFNSKTPIIGVQYATQQSNPVQIIFDDDLRDPAMAVYAFNDGDAWHKTGDAFASYVAATHSVLVGRSGTTDPIGEPATTSGLIIPPVHAVFSRDYVTGAEAADAALAYGGIVSPDAVTSLLGTLTAAVRFTSLTDTSLAPYYLQIIRSDTDVVLIEKPLPASSGQFIEDFLSLEIGALAPAGTPVSVGLVQKTKVASSILLDTLSCFDAGIIWDFSVDGGTTFVHDDGSVRNNPNGAITFPASGTELVWRCRSSLQHMSVSSLQVRPIYQDLRTVRPPGVMRGPNLSTYDHEPPISEDPEFVQ